MKETKDKANKFKQLALKAKKELNEYKTKVGQPSAQLNSRCYVYYCKFIILRTTLVASVT